MGRRLGVWSGCLAAALAAAVLLASGRREGTDTSAENATPAQNAGLIEVVRLAPDGWRTVSAADRLHHGDNLQVRYSMRSSAPQSGWSYLYWQVDGAPPSLVQSSAEGGAWEGGVEFGQRTERLVLIRRAAPFPAGVAEHVYSQVRSGDPAAWQAADSAARVVATRPLQLDPTPRTLRRTPATAWSREYLLKHWGLLSVLLMKTHRTGDHHGTLQLAQTLHQLLDIRREQDFSPPPVEVANLHQATAFHLLAVGEHERALEQFQVTSDFTTGVPPDGADDALVRRIGLEARIGAAGVLSRLGRLEDARRNYQELQDELDRGDHGPPSAKSIHNTVAGELAYVESLLGHHEAAIRRLTLRAEQLEHEPACSPGCITVLSNLGELHTQTLDFEPAERAFAAGLAHLGSKKCSCTTTESAILKSRAGTLYADLGDLALASRLIAEARRSPAMAQPKSIALLLSIARGTTLLGDFAASSDALDIVDSLNSTSPSRHSTWEQGQFSPLCLIEKGLLASRQGQHATAVSCLEKAIQSGRLSRLTRQHAEFELAFALLVSGEATASLSLLRKSVIASDAPSDHRNSLYRYWLAQALARTHQNDAALSELRVVQRSLGVHSHRLRIHAYALEKFLRPNGTSLKSRDAAVQSYLGLIHRLLNDSSEAEIIAATPMLGQFEQFLHTAPDDSGTLYSLMIARRSLLLKRSLVVHASANRKVLERIRELKLSLSGLEFSSPEPVEISNRLDLRGQLNQVDRDAAKRVARGFERWVESDYSSLIAERVPEGSVCVDVICPEASLNPDGKGPQGCVAYITSHGSTPQRVVLGSVSKIEGLATRWIGSIARRERDPEAAMAFASEAWTPIEMQLPKGTRRIVLSTSGALAGVPWCAIPIGDDRLLLDDFSLVTCPCPSFLVTPEVIADGSPRKNSVLVVGGVDYRRSVGPVRGDSQIGAHRIVWPSLPGSYIEAHDVASLAAPHNAVVLTGKVATSRAVVEALESCRFSHVSTHGVLASAGRELSLYPYTDGKCTPLAMTGMVFAARESAAGIEEILTAEAVSGLNLRGMELAFVAACDSAKGVDASAAGILNIQQAFHMAGAQNVIAALWRIDDAATRSITRRFYEHLWKDRLSIAESLRQAQLFVRRNPGIVEQERQLTRGVDPGDGRPLTEIVGAAANAPAPEWLWAGFTLSTIAP